MAMQWSQVEQTEQYLKLNPVQREQLKQRYVANVGAVDTEEIQQPEMAVEVNQPEIPSIVPQQTETTSIRQPYREDMFLKSLTPEQIAESKRLGGRTTKEGMAYQTKLRSEFVPPVSEKPQVAPEELIATLGGKIPIPEQEYQNLQNIVMKRGETGELVPHLKNKFYEETRRRKAYQDLLKQYDPKQIETVLEVQRKMQRFPYGRAIGATAGSIGLPALVNLIPGMAALPEEAATIPFGIKAGRVLAAILGAGVGGGAGEAAQTALEEKRLASRKEITDAALTEMATEAGMRGAARTGKYMLSPFIKQTIPEAASLVDDFSKAGIILTPAQMDRRLVMRAAEEVSRGAFGAKSLLDELASKNVNATKIYADRILDSIADGISRKGTAELGEEFAKDISAPTGRIFSMIDDIFNPLYGQIDELSAGVKVKTSPLKELARGELERDARMMAEGGKGLYLTPKGRMALKQILGLKDEIGFSDMRAIRSTFIADARSLGRDLDRTEALIKRLSQKANESITEPSNWKSGFAVGEGGVGYTGMTPEAQRLLENTNRLYKSTMEAFEETFPSKIIKRLNEKPADVTRLIFKPKNAQAIRQLRQSLVEPISGRLNAEGKVMWNQLRTAWLADVVDNATKEGKLNYHTIDDALIKMGGDAVKEIFPGNDYNQVENIRNTLRILTRKPFAGAALFVRGGQITGGVMLYNGYQEGDFVQMAAGGTLIMGPYFYIKMASNPAGQKLLTAGFKHGFTPGTKAFAPSVARIINLANKMDKEERQKKAKTKVKEMMTGRELSRMAETIKEETQ